MTKCEQEIIKLNFRLKQLESQHEVIEVINIKKTFEYEVGGFFLMFFVLSGFLFIISAMLNNIVVLPVLLTSLAGAIFFVLYDLIMDIIWDEKITKKVVRHTYH